ncbi:putative cysteine protease [Capsicum annuum]|nr:putative cysteine protease [Capsicum annuum]
MGKNQAYKAMQRARLGSSSAGPDEVDDGMVDGSFHTPEWHAARLASLKTSHTVTWEEFKKKQKEEEVRKGELEADKDKMMREYRAQLDAERASKLSQGRNHSSSNHSRKKGEATITKVNNLEDKGSPCHKCLNLKRSVGFPLTKAENLTMDMQNWMYGLHLSPKPVFFISQLVHMPCLNSTCKVSPPIFHSSVH